MLLLGRLAEFRLLGNLRCERQQRLRGLGEDLLDRGCERLEVLERLLDDLEIYRHYMLLKVRCQSVSGFTDRY